MLKVTVQHWREIDQEIVVQEEEKIDSDRKEVTGQGRGLWADWSSEAEGDCSGWEGKRKARDLELERE